MGKKQLGLGIALALVSSVAAAGTAQIDTSGSISTIEYRDGGFMRMGTGNDAYMLVRGDKLYMVNGAPGQEMVIDASGVLGMIGSMVPDTGTSASEVGSVEKTGRRETVAGIDGEVWVISYTDGDGNLQSEEVVVSRDARAAEFRQAMEDFSRAMLTAMGQDPESLDAMDDTFRDEGVGMLRFGDTMKVVNLSNDSVSESRFELPAEPTDLAGLAGGFGGAASGDTSAPAPADSQGQGGIFGGIGNIFSRQAERQQERQEDRAEREAQGAVDRAADSAADRVLDRLFGR